MVHSAFDIGEEIIAEFEEANNAKIVILEAGSSGEVLNRAVLEKGNPSADLLYGIDNTFLGRALKEAIFVPYESPMMSNVPDHLVLDESFHVTPVDYGYVNINYDKAALEEAGVQPPATLEELTQPEWEGKLVVQNPSTSSPGLAFLIATVSYFGEDDDYDYLDFWADLKANGLLVKDSWSDAYYTDFTKYGGDRPLVVSYATSPAAEVFFSEVELSEPPTGNVLVDKATFLQIEGIGILKGKRPRRAGAEVHRLRAGHEVPGGLPGQDVRLPRQQPGRDARLLQIRRGADPAVGHRPGGDRREARGVDRRLDTGRLR